MINYKSGFTLVELMVVVSVIAVLLIGGTMVMFRTLGSRAQNQADININLAGSQTMEALEQGIRFASVTGVGSQTRTDCLVGAVTGTTLTVSDAGGVSTYSLSDDGRIASTSGVPRYLSSLDMLVSDLEFTWICIAGTYDKVRISFEMDDPDLDGEILKRNFERDINMYNSGI